MVYSKDENEIKKAQKQSKYITFQKCITNCKLSFINYKIELKDFENEHKTSNILIDKFN